MTDYDRWISLYRSWHAWQHAYFATRPSRGRHVATGINGAVLRVMVDVLGGVSPHMPVADKGRPCRFCPA